jgi:hypothetical protein
MPLRARRERGVEPVEQRDRIRAEARRVQQLVRELGVEGTRRVRSRNASCSPVAAEAPTDENSSMNAR